MIRRSMGCAEYGLFSMSGLWWPLSVFGGVLLLFIGALAARRLWLMVWDRESVQGSDLHMLKWCRSEGTRAWGWFHLTFDEREAFSKIRAAIKRNMAASLTEPRSDFRRGVDLDRRRFVFHEHYALEDILEETRDDADFLRMGDPRKRELVYRLHTEAGMLGILFDHTVWDGVRIVNETLCPAIEARPFDERWLVKDRYYPVLSELLIVYASVVMGWRWSRHRPLQTLPEERDQRVVRHKITTSEVKALKNAASCKFGAALLAMWSVQLFDALTDARDWLRFGVLIGMDSPRFRNNYSILTIDVRRRSDAIEIAREIDSQMQWRRIEVLPIFHLISLLEIQTLFKANMVDCLFSPAVFERQDGPSLHVDDFHFFNIRSTLPLYTFACTVDETVMISTTWNAPEVSLERLQRDACDVHRIDDGKVLVAESTGATERPEPEELQSVDAHQGMADGDTEQRTLPMIKNAPQDPGAEAGER